MIDWPQWRIEISTLEFQLELKQVVDVINAYVNLDERVFMKAPPDFEEQGKGLWPFGSDHLIAPMINFRDLIMACLCGTLRLIDLMSSTAGELEGGDEGR